MDKWEYKVLNFENRPSNFDKILEETLNDLGKEGWELVLNNGGGSLYVLKRKELVLSNSNEPQFSW